MRPASIPRFPTDGTVVTQADEEKFAPYQPFSGALSPLRTPPATATTLFERTESPNQLSLQESNTWRDEWLRVYDKWYHWLKNRSWWVVAFALVTTVASSIAVGWSLRLKTFNIADGSQAGDSVIQLTANLVDVDAAAQLMTLDWLIDYNCGQISDCPDVNIFFDANTLRNAMNAPGPQNNSKPDPIFSINASNAMAAHNNTDRRSSSLMFRTDVAISSTKSHRTLQSYPYDKYYTQLIFFAERADTNSSIAIAIVKTTGIAVGFNVQLQDTTDLTDNFGTVIKNIEVTRGGVVRLYAIFIVLVIWLVTLTFMATCVMSVFFGKGISSGVLVLPMGTLFAFTQLRSTLPGAPEGFGAVIDFVGLLPCLAILTLCSVFMTAVFLYRNPEQDSPKWNWDKPGEGRTRRAQRTEHRKTLTAQTV